MQIKTVLGVSVSAAQSGQGAFQLTLPGGATCTPRKLAWSIVCFTRPVALASSIKSLM